MMKIHFRRDLKKYLVVILFSPFLISSCKSLNPAAVPPPMTPPVSYSTANVPLVIPKQTLDNLINQQIPRILLEEKGLDMGNGIQGDLTFTRNGEASWKSLDGQQIEVTIPVRIQGELGLKKGGLGNFFQSKVPLDKSFKPVFVLNPEINSDWGLEIRDFELLDLGGKIELSVLGMDLDLSGIVRKEIRNWASQKFGEGKTLVSFKPFVTSAWDRVGKPFMVDFGPGKTGFSVQPESVKLKEFFDSGQNYNLWLGLNGKVNTHPAEAFPSRAFPLPGLSTNENSENKLEIVLPLTLTYSQLNELLGENLNGKTFKVDKKTSMTPSNIQSSAFGELLAVSMDFFAEQTNGKSLNGKLFVVGKPAYDAATQSLILKDLNFKIESGNLGAQTSIGLKKGKIIRQIEKRAVFPIGNVLEESLGGIQNRLALDTPYANLKVSGVTIIPGEFFPTANGLMVQLIATGKVDVGWK